MLRGNLSMHFSWLLVTHSRCLKIKKKANLSFGAFEDWSISWSLPDKIEQVLQNWEMDFGDLRGHRNHALYLVERHSYCTTRRLDACDKSQIYLSILILPEKGFLFCNAKAVREGQRFICTAKKKIYLFCVQYSQHYHSATIRKSRKK